MARKPKQPKQKSFDVDLVRSAAARRWPEILARLGGIDAELLDGNHHQCPKCGGTDRFRMIDADAGALFCNQCFHERNGDGFAAVQWLCDVPFGQALARIAEYLGIEPTDQPKRSGKHSADPAKDLRFLAWNDGLAETWCVLYKPGIKPSAMLAVGARLARYRDQYTVFALPIWGPKLTVADPVGWCLYSVSGGTLPKRSRDGKSVAYVKTKLTLGSQPGIVGPVDRLAECSTVWKTEGPTDLLALLSLELPEGTTAITNAMGAGEKPAAWMLELWKGKHGYVVHDADQPGERGAAGYDDPDKKHRPGWCEQIATQADGCWHVRLPYPVAETHGKDLRDYLFDGHGYADLLKLSEASPRLAVSSAAVIGPKAIESEDDPHRLARMNMDRYATHASGATLRYWRDEWYTWKPARGCYRRIGVEELRAKLGTAVKAEFDRINIEQQAEAWREETPKSQKVTKALVTNVLEATKSMTVIPSSVEPMTWLAGSSRERRNYVAMRNGILDLDRLLTDDDAELQDILRPHSPNWFSVVRLPYDFDPAAKCPKWEGFLERNLEMDPERIKILQEWAGYLLLPDTGQQKFLAMEGEGANGKSVYCAAMMAMLGFDNCSSINLDLLADKFVRSQTLGKLVNICPDVGEIDKTDEGNLKSFTSGDVMFFDRKHISGLNCIPTARLMLGFNNRPRFTDRSAGIWRRMLLIPFNVQISEGDRIKDMDKYWWWEQSGELPGMLLWAIRGLHRLRSQGRFTDSQMSQESIEDYRSEANPARAFLLDHVELKPGRGIRTSVLYYLYCKWTDTNGNRPLSERTFGKEVARVFRDAGRKRGGTRQERYYFYDGIDFTEDKICGIITESEATRVELFE